jgi:hypothetical protein
MEEFVYGEGRGAPPGYRVGTQGPAADPLHILTPWEQASRSGGGLPSTQDSAVTEASHRCQFCIMPVTCATHISATKGRSCINPESSESYCNSATKGVHAVIPKPQSPPARLTSAMKHCSLCALSCATGLHKVQDVLIIPIPLVCVSGGEALCQKPPMAMEDNCSLRCRYAHSDCKYDCACQQGLSGDHLGF